MAGGEGARQLSDVQRDRVWQRGSMITFLKEIIDDGFKRIVFVPTYMDVGVCIVDICVECMYTMHISHV